MSARIQLRSPLDPRGEQARLPTSVQAMIIHPSLQRTLVQHYYRTQFERSNRNFGVVSEMEEHGRAWQIHPDTGLVTACRSHDGDAHILVCLSSVSLSPYELPNGLVKSSHFTCQVLERDVKISNSGVAMPDVAIGTGTEDRSPPDRLDSRRSGAGDSSTIE